MTSCGNSGVKGWVTTDDGCHLGIIAINIIPDIFYIIETPNICKLKLFSAIEITNSFSTRSKQVSRGTNSK